jgi:hypothetical protein
MKRVNSISDWNLVRTQKEYPQEGLTHALWETSDEKFALYFYKIREYGVLRTCSWLQIVKNKSNPVVIYDSKPEIFDCNIYDPGFLENNLDNKGYVILRLVRFDLFRQPLVLINPDTLQYVLWDKFYVKYSLNENNSLRLSESFFDKEGNCVSVITEEYKLNELKWRSLTSGEHLREPEK